jgi:DNA-binding GntR family transcriptional regulator
MAERLAMGLADTSQPYRTAQAAVAERLRRAVLSGQLKPGLRLLQADVAAEMRTSTTPVREAMRELAGEGLLDLDPHRGVVVHRSEMSELKELYQVRMLLEPVAIGATVEHITPEQLDSAEKLLERMEREPDFAEWAILNQAFHSLLAEASGLHISTSILVKLRNLSSLYIASSLHRFPERIATGNAEHRALLEACRVGDAAQAQEIELMHLRHTLDIGGAQFAERDGVAPTASTS